ncbi:MAG TPA: polysaccharide biosynthesis tyrosine autokinase [Pyrinomonadaceae bacterium]|nr:polysaccharide biosynthesis tyrosine autokinase [Pyrinomonadaceae bacterium]
MVSHDTRLTATWSRSLDTPLHEISPSSGSAGNERDVRDYLAPVVRHKWLILTIVVVATSAAAIYALRLPPIYESTAVLQLDSKESLYMEDSRGRVIRTYSDNYDYQNTQVRLLSNPHLMRQVVLKLDLEHKPGFLSDHQESNFFSSIRRMFSRPAAPAIPVPDAIAETDVNELSQARIRQLEPYVATIAAGLKVQLVDSTSLVNVTMTHRDPQLAMEVVDTLTKVFVSHSSEYENRGTQEAAETLSHQIAELQTRIKEAEDARLNYLKSHDLPLAKGDGRNLTADRLGKLSSQLLDAENDRKQIEAAYESAKGTTELSALPSVQSSDEIKELRRTINQLQQKRTSLLQIYTADWPEVKKIESEIRQVQDLIAKSSSEAVGALKAKLDAAVGREAKLREAYYTERASANDQTQDEIALSSLNQQIDINRQVYNMLFQRQTEMQVNAQDKSIRLGIVTPAVVPSVPVGPQRASKIITAFLFSLMFGIGLAFVVHQFDNTLKSADDVAAHLSLPTLALIPTSEANGNGSFRSKVLRRVRTHGTRVTPLALSADLRSPTAEAYRHLLASLLFTPGRSTRTILVTSGSSLEGKTTVATNAAITLAQSGAKVLLIDCDLRRPRVHRYLGLENATGLTNMLSGGQDLDSLILSHELYPNLRIITAGPTPANPANFLGSAEMRDLVKLVGERFEHVVIDSPPASSFADASLVATLVDGVVIVAHSNRSSRGVVRRVIQRLEAVGANVYGVVLNHVDLRTDEYYSGYYNNYDGD